MLLGVSVWHVDSMVATMNRCACLAVHLGDGDEAMRHDSKMHSKAACTALSAPDPALSREELLRLADDLQGQVIAAGNRIATLEAERAQACARVVELELHLDRYTKIKTATAEETVAWLIEIGKAYRGAFANAAEPPPP